MPDTTSTETISRAQAGDVNSLNWLYAHHHPSVFRYLYYRLGDRQAAEDLASEVFLRMLQFLAGYRLQGAPFQAWLFQIARNLAVDHFRRASANRQSPLADDLPAMEADPAASLERTLTSENLRRALAQLSADQRDVIVMRFVIGMPLAQVAQTMRRSEDAIKGLQRRGLMALRVVLSEWEVPYD